VGPITGLDGITKKEPNFENTHRSIEEGGILFKDTVSAFHKRDWRKP
jgi:hypothetical protein